jgi:putative ABC transport system permease protein
LTRRRWFVRFLLKSIGQRKLRVAVAVSAVMIATAIVVSAVGLSLGIREKLGDELKAYGANIILAPGEGYLDGSVLEALRAEGDASLGVEDSAGQLYLPVAVRGAPVELIGLEMEKVREQGWRITGRWPAEDEMLLGTDLREALALQAGDTVALTVNGRDAGVTVSGIVERGGPEDASVLMNLEAAQRLSGLEGKLSAAVVRARSGRIRETVASLRDRFPGVVVKTLKQVANAEEAFLGKMELLMALVTVVVLIASTISVSSTMSATVLERLKEIGLMRAIGGTRTEVAGFFLAEGMLIGVFGGGGGYLVGFLCAQAVSRGAFGSFVSVPLFLLALALAMGLVIAIFASLFPLADAMRAGPASVLRGE